MSALADLYVQRKRTRGWRMPEGAINCTRPGRWGNPFVIVDGLGEDVWEVGRDWPCPSLPESVREHEVRTRAAEMFRHWVAGIWVTCGDESVEHRAPFSVDDIEAVLGGRVLVCWCTPGAPCHVQDVLLPLANPELVQTDASGSGSTP